MSKHIIYATYTGRIAMLIGKTALLRYEVVEGVLAQFDSLDLPEGFTRRWTWFPSEDFKIHETLEEIYLALGGRDELRDKLFEMYASIVRSTQSPLPNTLFVGSDEYYEIKALCMRMLVYPNKVDCGGEWWEGFRVVRVSEDSYFQLAYIKEEQ